MDIYYLMFVLPALIFSMWAQNKVKSTYRDYSTCTTYSRMTGFESARRILDANGLRNVSIECISGNLTDHYDPKTNTIRLSIGTEHIDDIIEDLDQAFNKVL